MAIKYFKTLWLSRLKIIVVELQKFLEHHVHLITKKFHTIKLPPRRIKLDLTPLKFFFRSTAVCEYVSDHSPCFSRAIIVKQHSIY